MSQEEAVKRSVRVAPGVALLLAVPLLLASPSPARGDEKGEKLWRELPPGAAPASGGCPDFAALVQRVGPSVVSLSITYQVEEAEDPELQSWFHWFRKRNSDLDLGSGFILRPDGYILTNQHLVDKAAQITVHLADGRDFPARVVGQDPRSDLALLKVQAQGLPAIPLGDSDRLLVGQGVIAIGNPLGLASTVTAGIVSALDREQLSDGLETSFIQTDASINPGNSGGPLINLRGEVVGINTAMVRSRGGTPRQASGIGFAIPINQAKRLLPQLAQGRVQRGRLGLRIAPLTRALATSLGLDRPRGALVQEVLRDSPADKAGLQPGDVVLSLNGNPVPRPSMLFQLTSTTGPDRKVQLVVLRDGKEVSVALVLAPEPEEGEEQQEPAEEAVLPLPAVALGLRLEGMPREEAAALGLPEGVVRITAIEQGSLAAAAGLHTADIVLRAGRSAVHGVDGFQRIVAQLERGEMLNLTVQRGERRLFFSVPLE